MEPGRSYWARNDLERIKLSWGGTQRGGMPRIGTHRMGGNPLGSLGGRWPLKPLKRGGGGTISGATGGNFRSREGRQRGNGGEGEEGGGLVH